MTRRMYFVLSLLLAIILAAQLAQRGGTERDVLYALSEYQGGLPEGALRRATEDELLLHVAYDLPGETHAYRAEQRYPGLAKEVYLSFGNVPEFKRVVVRYGVEAVIPVVHYFMRYESFGMQLQSAAGTVVGWPRAWWRGETLQPIVKLDMPQRVAVALMMIARDGYGFLNEFRVVTADDGSLAVERLSGERFFQGVKELLAHGILNLEEKYRTRQDITGWDMALPALEIASVALGGGAALKAAQVAARTASGGSRLVAAVQLTTLKGSVLLRSVGFKTAARYGAVGVGAYILVYHPAAVNTFIRDVATLVGVDPGVLQFLFWFSIILATLLACRIVLSPLLWLARMGRGMVRMTSRPRRAGSWRGAMRSAAAASFVVQAPGPEVVGASDGLVLGRR